MRREIEDEQQGGGQPALVEQAVGMGDDDRMTVVFLGGDDLQRQPLADNVAFSPGGDRLSAPIVVELVIDEGVIRKRRQQGVEVAVVRRANKGGYRGRQSRDQKLVRAYPGATMTRSSPTRMRPCRRRSC